MNPLFLFLICAVLCGLIAMRGKTQSSKADAQPDNQELDVDKQRQFESMLQDGERLIAVCPETRLRQRYWAVTDRRLLIEGKEGISDIPRSSIKKVVGLDNMGNKCPKSAQPESMLMLKVTADKKYVVSNGSSAFSALARELLNGQN